MESFTSRVRGLGPVDLDRPTPCTEWDVRRLLGHNVYENLWVPPIMEGMTLEEVGDRFEQGVLGDDPIEAWLATTGPACEAVEGRDRMVRTVHLSFGDVSGELYVQQRIVDLVVHTWDLAEGTGADAALDPLLVEPCLAWGEAWKPMLEQAGDWFDPPIGSGADADPQVRLLNLFGRQP